MGRRPVRELMREARQAINALAPQASRNNLSLDLRAALLNLDDALSRALSHEGNDTAGPDQLDVYAGLTTVREIARADGPDAMAAVNPVIIPLERRRGFRAKTPRQE